MMVRGLKDGDKKEEGKKLQPGILPKSRPGELILSRSALRIINDWTMWIYQDSNQ